jgi:hypothetical protein
MHKWVKIVGSDVQLEYPYKRVDAADGVHFHFEEDRSQAPKQKRITPTLLEDHGDGTYTEWSFGIYGPVGTTGPLPPSVKIGPLTTKADRAAACVLEKAMQRSLESQAAMVFAMSDGRVDMRR